MLSPHPLICIIYIYCVKNQINKRPTEHPIQPAKLLQRHLHFGTSLGVRRFSRENQREPRRGCILPLTDKASNGRTASNLVLATFLFASDALAHPRSPSIDADARYPEEVRDLEGNLCENFEI